MQTIQIGDGWGVGWVGGWWHENDTRCRRRKCRAVNVLLGLPARLDKRAAAAAMTCAQDTWGRARRQRQRLVLPIKPFPRAVCRLLKLCKFSNWKRSRPIKEEQLERAQRCHSHVCCYVSTIGMQIGKSADWRPRANWNYGEKKRRAAID